MALKLGKEIYDLIYPIGTIYETTSSTFNPNDTWYGSWELTAKGRTLVGAGEVEANTDNWCGTTNAGDWTAYAGAKGGEVSHKLTYNEIPAHAHSAGAYDGYTIDNASASANSGATWYQFIRVNTSSTGASSRIATNNAGGGQAHNNLPPYLVVYIWERKS